MSVHPSTSRFLCLAGWPGVILCCIHYILLIIYLCPYRGIDGDKICSNDDTNVLKLCVINDNTAQNLLLIEFIFKNAFLSSVLSITAECKYILIYHSQSVGGHKFCS